MAEMISQFDIRIIDKNSFHPVVFERVEDIEHRVLPGGSGWPGRSAWVSRAVSWRLVPVNGFCRSLGRI